MILALGRNDCSSVFETPRPKASPDHPTFKPVALVEAMLKNSSRTDEIVLDGFLGSGTRSSLRSAWAGSVTASSSTRAP